LPIKKINLFDERVYQTRRIVMNDTGKVEDYLRQHNVGTLATCANGVPHASSIEYVSDGLNLYFSTNPQTQKAINIRANNLVSLTVDEDYPDWTTIKGIQMQGIAQEVTNPEELDRALEVYVAKFPFVKKFPPSPNRMYKITPSQIWLLDYEKGFGHRDRIVVKE
jgi:uncharacterized protein YhbP (UPF0306 family)